VSFKQSMFAIGRFFRLLDDSNVISLTNIALMIVIGKLAVTPSLSIPEIGALLLGLLNYSYKRYIRYKEPKPEVIASKQKSEIKELRDVTDSLKDKIGKISAALSIMPRR